MDVTATFSLPGQPHPMLSYRHAFHAGNFADVLKHGVLAMVLTHLKHKSRPLLYLDTHAGAAHYPLTGERARATGEAEGGIRRLWSRDDWPAALSAYRAAVAACNTAGALRNYPGSPRVASHFLDDADRLLLHELHPDDHRRLQRHFQHQPRVQVHRADGLHALRAELPPVERRGAILIDPPYEQDREYAAVADALADALRRFATGVYLLWYPQLPNDPAAAMLRRLRPALTRPTLRIELSLSPDGPGLTGCGMLVVNPPWTLTRQADEAVRWLASVLGDRQARGRVRWEVSETAAADARA